MLPIQLYSIYTRVGYVISGRVPGYTDHLHLCRNRRFLLQKQDGNNKICQNSRISESKVNHKLTHAEFQFCWKFCRPIIISKSVIWCKNHGKHRETYQNLQHFSVYIGIRVTRQVNSYPDSDIIGWVPGYPGIFARRALSTSFPYLHR